MEDDTPPQESLLPYEAWQEEALRHVVLRALQHAAAEGLPGGHHFFIAFRTRAAGVELPARLAAQYPDEMTIVLQHQYQDLRVDEAAGAFSVVLSFGGVSSPLRIPLAAISSFVDPSINFGMHLAVADQSPAPPAMQAAPAPVAPPAAPGLDDTPQVVSLDAFRRRSPKE